MKKILVFLTLCLPIEFFAQQDCPMSYTGTDSNATIAITQESSYNFFLSDGINTISLAEVQCPIEIGVYNINDDGLVMCTGSSTWSNDKSFALAAWSDDSTTPEVDGMTQGGQFVFGICLDGSSSNNPIFSFAESYQIQNMSGGSPTFSSNGMYVLNSATFNTVQNVFEIQQPCWPVEINENNQNKKVKLKTDLIGRTISNDEFYSGFIIELYYDYSYRKVLNTKP